MKYSYRPQGTCSKLMNLELENGVIKNLEVIGGCDGNLKGITSLVIGMKAQDAIDKLKGIRCGYKSTSCPDQLSIALTQALEQEQK